MRFFILFLLIVPFKRSIFSQDSLFVDSNKVHSYKKAMIFSAILPGGGQIYNSMHSPKGKQKAYWKVPLIYTGLGASMYFAFSNLKLVRDYRSEVEYRDANPTLAPLNFSDFDREGLISLYTQRRTFRDLWFLGATIVYALNIVDAGVEAHFVNFDISDKLAFSWSPQVYAMKGFGIKTQFYIKNKVKYHKVINFEP